MSKPPSQRICQGCRKSSPKSELQRLVKTPDGQIHFDPDHKLQGRGFHWHPACSPKALISGKVSNFLKTDNNQTLKDLLEEIQSQLAKN